MREHFRWCTLEITDATQKLAVRKLMAARSRAAQMRAASRRDEQVNRGLPAPSQPAGYLEDEHTSQAMAKDCEREVPPRERSRPLLTG